MTVQLQNLVRPPLSAPGKNVSRMLVNGIYLIPANQFSYNESSPASLMGVPAHTLILGALCQVVTAFDGLIPALSLGVSGATSRHMASADIDLTTVGWYFKISPYEYTTPATIVATITPSTSTTGAARFWVIARLHSDLPAKR